MFKLIRLAVYGIVGYALYQFVTDVMNIADQQRDQGEESSRGGRQKAGGSPSRISGKRKSGKPEETRDADGGTTRHRVGRGVV